MACDKIKIIVKTKLTKIDSNTVEWAYQHRRRYYVHIINLFSHGIGMHMRYMCPYFPAIIQVRFD